MFNYSQSPRCYREKEFYAWLLDGHEISEEKCRHTVLEVARLEIIASALGCGSGKLYSSHNHEIYATYSDLLTSVEFKKYLLFNGKPVTDSLNALKAYMVFVQEEKIAKKEAKQKKPLIWTKNSILYVHKGKISCQRNGHPIIDTTAVLLTKGCNTVELSVSYCTKCGKFFIGEEAYNTYRKQYGALIGHIRLESSGSTSYNGEPLADASPLRLCGYTVNKTDNLSEYERQYIITQVIINEVMTKSEVINYLEYFIDHNGRQERNQLAVEKWQSDLRFTLSYNFEEQDRYLITDIQPYSSFRNNWNLVA